MKGRKLKKKLLIITASPRKQSNSTAAAIALAGSLKEYTPEFININLLKIKPCTACNKCEKTFACVIKDDAQALIKKIKKAAAVIVASPVYFTGVPAPLKAFIDRNQSEWRRWNNSKSKIQYPISKNGYIVLTSGGNEKRWFAPAVSEIRSFFAVNGIKSVKVIKIGGMDKAGIYGMRSTFNVPRSTGAARVT
jgi:multimeric flavodoxin WrbA